MGFLARPVSLNEDLLRLAQVARRRGEDGLFADQNLSPGPYRVPHVVFADELGGRSLPLRADLCGVSAAHTCAVGCLWPARRARQGSPPRRRWGSEAPRRKELVDSRRERFGGDPFGNRAWGGLRQVAPEPAHGSLSRGGRL